MTKKLLSLFFILSLLLTPSVFAQDTIWDKAESPQYGSKAGGMLGRGLINVLTFPIDIVVQTVKGAQEGPAFVGTMKGIGGGLGCGVLRAGSGVIDVVTFWVPGFNGVPVARSYEDCTYTGSRNYSSSSYQSRGTNYVSSSQPASSSYVVSTTGSSNTGSYAVPSSTAKTPSYVKSAAPYDKDSMKYVKK